MKKQQVKSLYIFEFHINIVYEYIKDFKKTDSLFKYLRSNTEITKGINTYTDNSSFYYIVAGHKKIEFSTETVIDEEVYKSIKWNVTTVEMNYSYQYNFYYCSDSNETVLEWILSYEDDCKISMNKGKILEEQSEIMKEIKEFIVKDKVFITISSGLIIKTERLSVIKYVLDLNQVKSVNDYFGKVEYQGDPQKIKSKIIFSMSLLGIVLKYEVFQSDFNEKNKEWVYGMRLIEEDDFTIRNYVKEIVFFINCIHSKKVFVEMKYKVLACMSNKKVVELKKTQVALLKLIFDLENEEKDKEKEE